MWEWKGHRNINITKRNLVNVIKSQNLILDQF